VKKAPKDKDEAKEQYEERIKRLEKRVKDLEKKDSGKKSRSRTQVEKEPGGEIGVEGLVGGIGGQFIPGLGGIIKALEKSSPEFRNRIADTDAEIKHRIDVGWSSKPVVDYHVSTRLLSSVPRRRTAPREVNVRMPEKGPVREPIVDQLDGKDYITVIAELPGITDEDLKVHLAGESLEINAGQFSKTVALPCTPKSIIERTYKNGILQLKIERAVKWP
jgi:HSP20 family molecular chaperone IbpA